MSGEGWIHFSPNLGVEVKTLVILNKLLGGSLFDSHSRVEKRWIQSNRHFLHFLKNGDIHVFVILQIAYTQGRGFDKQRNSTLGTKVKICVLLKCIIRNFCYFVYFCPTYNLDPLDFGWMIWKGMNSLKTYPCNHF